MSIARAIARRLFGRSIEVLDLEIAFHKQANHFGTHGVMIASHKDLEAAKAQMEARSAQPARDAVRRNVRLISQSILADNEAIKRMRAELVEVDQRFDADRLRLRQLLREPEPTLRPVANPTAAPHR